MKHLVLVDGHHLMHRAYWAIPRTLKTRSGEQVNTVFGVASMLLSILGAEEPDALLFCFDAGSDTFRHQENETYKDGRAETPDDFYVQVPKVHQLIDAFGLKSVADPQYEADDFIATYACRAVETGWRVTIVSGDRDLLQLVNGSVRVAIPHKGYQSTEYLDAAKVQEKYGITPQQVPAYKGLCGDPSDNLPGVRGIGPKTAAELISQYGSLSEIYAHLDDIRSAVAGKLLADKDQAFFCERMATLECAIPLPVSLDAVSLDQLSSESILSFFADLDFSLLIRRFSDLLQSDFGKAHFTELPLDHAQMTTNKKPDQQLSIFD